MSGVKLILVGFVALIICSLFNSCKNETKRSSEILVEIGSNKFTKEDLKNALPLDLSSEDSLIVAEQIIRSWIDEQLLYIESVNKLNDTTDIHKKVEHYRRELYIYNYNKSLVEKRLDTVVELKELKDYYNKYLGEYVLNEPVFKVHYLTMSSQVIGYYVERDMVKTTPLNNLDRLIEFCKGTGRKVHIIDEWIKVSDLQKIIPCMKNITNESLQQTKYYECFDDVTRYLLMVDESINSGEHAPFELLEPVIRDIIIHQRKNELLNIYRQNLYSDAKSNGTLVINY
jgi:uncharacterized protein YihD (DUF1040 family)